MHGLISFLIVKVSTIGKVAIPFVFQKKTAFSFLLLRTERFLREYYLSYLWFEMYMIKLHSVHSIHS